MSRKFGIDISSWQAPAAINYNKLAKQIDFAILRVGYTGHGTGVSLHKDDAFEHHYAELHGRGIPLGVYWYSCANTPDKAIKEAKKCLEFIQGKELLYPVFIDVEDTHHQQPVSAKQLTDSVIAFCDTIEKAGYYVGIYSSSWWFNNEMEFARLAPMTSGWLSGVSQNQQFGKVSGNTQVEVNLMAIAAILTVTTAIKNIQLS